MVDLQTGNVSHNIIVDLIPAGSSVLDLGCGDGELLRLLEYHKDVHGQGIEIAEQAVRLCIEKGLHVLHGDIDSGLSDYPDGSFDYVIMNESLQQVLHFEPVLKDALRVGKRVIVGFPNFAYITARLQIFFHGRTPVTPALPYAWYQTPNVHCLSISDFIRYCNERPITIEQSFFLGMKRRVTLFPNLLAMTGLFLISGKGR